MNRYVIVFTIMTVLYLPISLVAVRLSFKFLWSSLTSVQTVFGTDLFDSGDPADNIDRFKTSAIATSVSTYALSLILVWLADRLDLPQSMLRKVKGWLRVFWGRLTSRPSSEKEDSSFASPFRDGSTKTLFSRLRHRDQKSAA